MQKQIESMKYACSDMSSLRTNYRLNLILQKVEQGNRRQR